MNRFSMLKGAAAIATLAAMAAPTFASAQSYDYRRHDNGYGYGQTYDYRSCTESQRDRQAAGAVIGATIGAVAGSQMSARGRRTENSVLGGVLGAVIGAGVGGDSANCRADARYGYDQRDYRYGGYGYDGYSRDRRYDDRRYDDRYGYGYGQDAYGYDRNGCRTVETLDRDRYGREVTRYEQVCRQGY